MKRNHWRVWTIISGLIAVLLLAGCATGAGPAAEGDASQASTPDEETSLMIYSGRNENLVGPLIDQYREQGGTAVDVRYGGTSEMAATIMEEGKNSPADVFYGQDAGALGALAKAGRCIDLPDEIIAKVDPRFASPDKRWVGVSGRARVLVYNTDELSEDQLPASVFDLTDEQWRGRVGWAPTNGSFQSFVTAMRAVTGEDATRAWLEGMIANDAQVYPKNAPIVEAVGRGEISVGLVNHYYLYRFLAEDPDFPAANYHFPNGDVGSMINVAGVCVLDTSDNQEQGLAFVDFLLSNQAQQYFASETNEYPLAGENIEIDPRLTPLDQIQTPDLDLSDIDDLQGTLQLLQEVGALQ